MLGFVCIALGVAFGFMLDGWAFGGMIALHGLSVSPQTAGLVAQAAAAFTGTIAFAGLFGVSRVQCPVAGIIGAAGWVLYLVLVRYAGTSPMAAIILSSVFICVLARIAAVWQRSPAQVFLLCGIFPLVPGAGLFWFSYYMVSGQIPLSLSSGLDAVKAAVAIVLGIILAMELPQRLFSGRSPRTGRTIH